MRNASDIFCLDGSGTDGNGMFSINGSCPMKLKRRPQISSDECFQYGRGNIEKLGGDSKVQSDLDHLLTDSEETDGSKGDNPCSPPDSARKTNFKKIDDKKTQEGVATSSNMIRNPLTGAGMETDENHKRTKKMNPNKLEKWIW